MDQQVQRKQELFDTLICLESQKENEQQDFWLLQYQKLLDSQPCELSFKSSSINPLLGYNFLVHGVVHCIPFLSKLWQSHNCTIDDINDDDLIEAGIKTSTDREQILKSIKEFIKQTQTETQAKSVESCDEQRAIASEPSAPSTQDPSTNIDEVKSDLSSECVICMEQTVRHHLKYKIQWQLITFFFYGFQCKIIFLPCGHLCCCYNCQNTIEDCPMCRAKIERRIKVIQA